MNKKTRIIAIVLAAGMILSVLMSTVAMIAANASSDLEKAQNELAQLENERKSIEAELAKLEEDKENAHLAKIQIENQIVNTISQITATEKVIEELVYDIEIQTEKLIAAETKMNDQYETFKTRVRVMYEGGETTYLDILLSSGDFVTMLSNLDKAQQIMDYDKELFDDYTEQAEIVEAAKIALEENKASQDVHKQNLSTKKNELDSDLAASAAIVAQIESDEAAQEELLDAAYEAEQEASRRVAELARQSSGGDYVGGTFTWPAPGNNTITSPFGNRIHPVTGVNKFHSGTDIAAPYGATIVAGNAGRVIVSEYSSSYGNYVMVDHGGGMVTLYAHLTNRSVVVGQTVAKGEQVGTCGSTGISTGPHLHFEVIKNGVHQDAMNYFS